MTKTQVYNDGIFWRVRVFLYGKWIVLRDLHLTRAKARETAKFVAINY